MPRYSYIAELHGQRVAGELDATDIHAARHQLFSQGAEMIELRVADESPAISKLSASEAEQVLVTLAEVSDSQLPLAGGLRAAANECSSRRVARALMRIASDVEAGLGLETIMIQRSSFLPGHVRELISTAARTRSLSSALEDLIQHEQDARDLRSLMISSFAYPLFVVLATCGLLVVLSLWVVPQFEELFREFKLDVPVTTKVMIALSVGVRYVVEGAGKWVVLGFAIALLFIVWFVRSKTGPGLLETFLTTIPLIGPMWHWNGVAVFVRLLAVMLEHGVPLPTALTFVGDGLSHFSTRKAARVLAATTAQGQTLTESLPSVPWLPTSIFPLIHWGESVGQLPEALRTSSQMLTNRVQMRVVLLRAIGPPLVFILIAVVIGFCIAALFRPLISFIQTLA